MNNVNDKVQVTLTEEGRLIWNQHYEGYKILQLQVEPGGSLKTELWKLMEVFGPHVRMGGPQHFVRNEIRVVGPIEHDGILSFTSYQEGAERTANRKDVDTVEKRLANFALGLAGESGEVADYVKKHLFHGHALDREKVKKELGDVLWYVATMARTLGIGLEEVAQGNLDKLRARYPEGFSTERSVNREERAESETLPDPKEAPTMTRLKTTPPEDAGQ